MILPLKGDEYVCRLIELKMKRDALKKKLEQVEAELEEVYFQIDDELLTN